MFGVLADRYGRRPVLMFNILSFSLIELACAFAPSLSVLLILRALFGIAMGGEWGVGAALAFETLPTEGRSAGDVVPVKLHAYVTETGMLQLEAVPRGLAERWKVEFDVRGGAAQT